MNANGIYMELEGTCNPAPIGPWYMSRKHSNVMLHVQRHGITMVLFAGAGWGELHLFM